MVPQSSNARIGEHAKSPLKTTIVARIRDMRREFNRIEPIRRAFNLGTPFGLATTNALTRAAGVIPLFLFINNFAPATYQDYLQVIAAQTLIAIFFASGSEQQIVLLHDASGAISRGLIRKTFFASSLFALMALAFSFFGFVPMWIAIEISITPLLGVISGILLPAMKILKKWREASILIIATTTFSIFTKYVLIVQLGVGVLGWACVDFLACCLLLLGNIFYIKGKFKYSSEVHQNRRFQITSIYSSLAFWVLYQFDKLAAVQLLEKNEVISYGFMSTIFVSILGFSIDYSKSNGFEIVNAQIRLVVRRKMSQFSLFILPTGLTILNFCFIIFLPKLIPIDFQVYLKQFGLIFLSCVVWNFGTQVSMERVFGDKNQELQWIPTLSSVVVQFVTILTLTFFNLTAFFTLVILTQSIAYFISNLAISIRLGVFTWISILHFLKLNLFLLFYFISILFINLFFQLYFQ